MVIMIHRWLEITTVQKCIYEQKCSKTIIGTWLSSWCVKCWVLKLRHFTYTPPPPLFRGSLMIRIEVFLLGTLSLYVLVIADLLCCLQAFSPNLKYVASVGFQHDMIVNIWNWKVWYCNTTDSRVLQNIFQVVKQWQGCVLYAVPKLLTPYILLLRILTAVKVLDP